MDEKTFYRETACENFEQYKEEIRRKVLRSEKILAKRNVRGWMVAAALLLAVSIAIGAVPEARAAVGGFFNRVFDMGSYFDSPDSKRPAEAKAAVSQMAQKDFSADPSYVQKCQPLYEMAPGADWIKNVKISVTDVWYNGLMLYVGYDVDPGGEVFLNERDVYENNKLLEQTGGFAREWILRSITPEKGPITSAEGMNLLLKQQGGKYHATQEFLYKNDGSGGRTDALLCFAIGNMKFGEKDAYGRCISSEFQGNVYVPFAFNADNTSQRYTLNETRELAGTAVCTFMQDSFNEMETIYTNKQEPLRYLRLTAEYAERRANELSIRFKLEHPKTWSEEQYATILDSLNFIAYAKEQKYMSEVRDITSTDKVWEFELVLPFLPQDIKDFDVHVFNRYLEKLIGKTVALDTPYTYPVSMGGKSGISEAFHEIKESRFTIHLP